MSSFEEGAGYSKREGSMNTKLYLTVAAVVAILYALAFLLIPVQASLFFSDFAEPRAILYLRFCGAAILAWGLFVWFARHFEDRYAVRSVLIASAVGLAVNIAINVWATLQGWLNARAWGSTVVLVLLLLGGGMNSRSVCLMTEVSCARVVLINCTIC
jgi:hypothetical protein